nr:hypothetical protein CFP56_03570 [Quercus suber]
MKILQAGALEKIVKASQLEIIELQHSVGELRKSKVREIEEKNQPGGNEKWKIKGQQSQKRTKQRWH